MESCHTNASIAAWTSAIALFDFGVGFTAHGSMTVGGVEDADGIAEERAAAGASIGLGSGG